MNSCSNSQTETKIRKGLSEAERLEIYFDKLISLFPAPPKDWELYVKPCKWDKILKENRDNPDATG